VVQNVAGAGGKPMLVVACFRSFVIGDLEIRHRNGREVTGI